MPEKLRQGGFYLTLPIEDPEGLIRKIARIIKGSNVQFDTIVGRGLSGALILPGLARALGVDWAIVRKPNESIHDPSEFVGTVGERWLFVDDQVDSGETRKRTMEAIQRAVDDTNAWRALDRPKIETKYVGSYLYNFHEFEDLEED